MHETSILFSGKKNKEISPACHLLSLPRPKMTWKLLTESDCKEWKLSAIDPHDRHTWRSGVRSAMSAASQLPGRGPTDVDVAPVPAH